MARKSNAGRKSKYNPTTVKKLVRAIKLGCTHQLACDSAGISHTTFYDWMNTKPEFFEAIKEAEGEGALELLERINKAADEGTWQAAAWILERRHTESYGRQRIEHTGADGGAIQIKVVREDDND